jgi:hypothetical protein
MEPYDPTLEALVDAMIQALDHEAEMTRGYVDKLRQLTVTMRHILADPGSHEPTPEQEQVMRQALGMLDAKAGDAELDYLDVLRRCQAAVEKELFKWDSSIVQPAGFSGEIQIPVGGGEWETHSPPSDEEVLRQVPAHASRR